MASDYTPTNVTSGYEMEVSINLNFTEIKTAMDKMLNRSVSSDNAMQQVLDMNGYSVLNLPAPSTPTEALRLMDLELFEMEGASGIANAYVALGIGLGDTDLGTFDKDIIRDTAVTKEALQDLEYRLYASNVLFSDRADLANGTPLGGGSHNFALGQVVTTVSSHGTVHGGWIYDVTSDTPNGLNKIDLGGSLTATARKTGGVIPAGAYGAVLDNITDDFNALTELHNDAVSYSLEGKRAYITGTLTPKSGQTIYPHGGGLRKDTAGYMFSKDGVCDRFEIKPGGLFLGEHTSDFLEMEGGVGFGNAWTNCIIDGVGSQFVTAFRMSNARRCTLRGRWSARSAVEYVNKSAECTIEFANFVRTGVIAGTVGITCDDDGDGYPEGLVMSGGMFFDFSKNANLLEGFELNFNSVEFATSSGTYAADGHQIDVKAKTGGFARGIYFDSNCHFSGRGIQFGDGTDTSPHSYDAIISGSFRNQKAGTTISLSNFQSDIHISDGTLFRWDGVAGTRVAVLGTNNNQGVSVGAIKVYGYDSYVQFKGAGSKNVISNIANLSDLALPVSNEYAVCTQSIQGLSGIVYSDSIATGTFNATDVIKTTTLELGEGSYLIRARLDLSSVGTSGTMKLGVAPTGSGTAEVPDGGGWSSVFKFIRTGETQYEQTTYVTVTKGGEFDIDFESVSAVLTAAGAHDFLSVERLW